MTDVVTYRGTTYRMGHGGTPLALTALMPDTLPRDWEEIPSPFRRLVTREYSRAYRSQHG
jgi:hypothetical protein